MITVVCEGAVLTRNSLRKTLNRHSTQFRHRRGCLVEKKPFSSACVFDPRNRSSIFRCFFGILRACPSLKSGSPWTAHLQNTPLNIRRTIFSTNSHICRAFHHRKTRRINSSPQRLISHQLALRQADFVVSVCSKPKDSPLLCIRVPVRRRCRECVT
jgi:hypothetical protein